MDEIVARSLAKWPNVPAVYGWLLLDRRGNWLIRSTAGHGFERIGNSALREFIGRNYEADKRGCWYFQNGPQRVYVKLAYTPLVVRSEGDGLVDQCGRPFTAERKFVDEEGSVLVATASRIALVDDRDLERFAEGSQAYPRVLRADIAARYGFEPDPHPN